MKKSTIFNSWDYLENPEEAMEIWECERNLLTDFFKFHAHIRLYDYFIVDMSHYATIPKYPY